LVVADRLTSFMGLLIMSAIGFALSPSSYSQGLIRWLDRTTRSPSR